MAPKTLKGSILLACVGQPGFQQSEKKKTKKKAKQKTKQDDKGQKRNSLLSNRG